MTDRRRALTPEALEMMDSIARSGSFAAAARELGKVPSALTYSVRQLEEALDVLLFDRRSRQAQLTAAGEELLREGRRLLLQMDAVANRVQRVATGWEATLSVAVDSIIAAPAIFDLMDAFFALKVARAQNPPARPGAVAQDGEAAEVSPQAPPTRLKLRSEVMSGTWEALINGQVDLAIGVMVPDNPVDALQCAPLGLLDMVFAVAPHHPLAQESEPLAAATVARHRVVAIADTAQRLAPQTFGVSAGQDVLTVPSLVAKLEAIIRGLGCGRMPEPLVRLHADAGRLVVKRLAEPQRAVEMHYAWRRSAAHGKALAWWLQQLERPTTRRALLEQHAGLIL
ncbi:MAG TPA: LysR family transcriptional regulator [Burkholderiaceae bacterium]|nr:LysR family transcriptional regulator [Burkholderiaceae bacterium]